MTKTITAKKAFTIFKSKRTPPLTFDDGTPCRFDDESPLTFDDESPLTFDDESPLTFDDESPLTFDDESPLTFDDESELTFDDETAVFKDAMIQSWDNGSPESGEYVIRVSLMARDTHENEWTHQSVELRFDNTDERDESIQHYTKLYDVKSA